MQKLGPLVRGKIRRVLNKTQTVPYKRQISSEITRHLAKTRLISDEICRLYVTMPCYPKSASDFKKKRHANARLRLHI